MANATPNLTRKTLVTIASEDTYGVDASPATSGSGSGAYLLFDEINPLQIDTQVVEQQSVRASYSKRQDLIGRQLWMLRPKTMIMGSPGADISNTAALAGVDPLTGTGQNAGGAPTDGLPPFFNHLLKACAMSETIDTSTSVQYKPVSSGFDSATAHVWADNHKTIIKGLYGNVTFEGRAGEALTMDFDLKGVYDKPEPVNIPTDTTYPADNKVLVQNEALVINNGSAYTPIVRSFRFDVGNQIIERRDMNSSRGLYGIFISDRRPTLELVVEVDALGTFDPFDDIANETTGINTTHAISFRHGGAGTSANESKFTFNKCQLTNVQYQDDQGIRTYAFSYNLTPDADDDDFAIDFGDQS